MNPHISYLWSSHQVDRLVAMLVIAVHSSVCSAQSTITWSTTDAGGGRVEGTSGLALEGTIGQWDASPPVSTASLTLAPGFWPGAFVLPACVADLDDGSGTGLPDGGVTIEDLLYYLDQYAQGTMRADLDDGSGTGVPDGGVTIDDLLYFLVRYEAGC